MGSREPDSSSGDDPVLDAEELRGACAQLRNDMLDSLDVDRARGRLMSSLFGRRDPSVRIGPYVLERRLGAGAMGEVYVAHDDRLDRKIAVKVVRGLARDDIEELRRRLRREAQALARLSHPNVLSIYDFGEHAGRLYIAMELVDGVDLSRWLKLRRRRVDEILDVYHQAGRGLAAAHALGLLHRDFKPSNVLVGNDHRVRVADFGLAIATTNTQSGGAPTQPTSDQAITGPGTGPGDNLESTSIVGTPAYMAPEQASGGRLDARSDQYSFCVSIFRSLPWDEVRPPTGQRARLDRASREHRVRLQRLYRVLMRGLSPDPSDRYDSMEQLLAALAKARRASSWPKRRALAVAAGGVALAALALGTAPRSQERCHVDPEQVQGWTPQRRDAVRARFESSPLTFAASSGERVLQRLDAEANAWSQEYAAACEATHRSETSDHDRTLDHRIDCLRRRATELDAVTEVLAQADDEMIRHAVEIVEDLEPMSTCLHGPPEEHTEGTSSPDHDEIHRLLAGANALLLAGQYEQSEHMAEQATRMADLAGLDAPRAEARFIVGTLARMQTDGPRAVQYLEAAYWIAQEHGYHAIAIEAALELVTVHGVVLTNPQQAHEWVEHARALTRRLGADPAWAPRLCWKQGQVLRAEGRLDEALKMGRCAVDGFSAPDVADPNRTAQARISLAILLDELGHHQQARGHYEHALAFLRERHGPEHPLVGELYMNLGSSHYNLGQFDEALRWMQRSQRILRRSVEASAPLVIVGYSIGGVLLELGHIEPAVDQLDESLAIAQQLWPDGHQQTAAILSNRGGARVMQGRYDDAARDLAASIAMIEHLMNPDHPALVTTLDNLGFLYLEHTDEPRRALKSFERERRILETIRGPDHLSVARALVLEARCFLALDDLASARSRLSRARSIREQAPPGGEPTLERIDELMAEVQTSG